MKIRYLLSAFLFAACGRLAAQTPDTGTLSRYMEALAKNDRFMGSVALSKDGNIFYRKAVGLANTATAQPNTPQTLFRIGSISKTFTAALVLKAAEEGKLRLSDPLRKYFPKLKVVSNATIEQALRHRSGIHNITSEPTYLSWHTSPQTREQMLTRIEKGGRDFTADSTFAYSNSGYLLLSYLLEDVYKKPFAQILETRIARPLGLKNTGVYASGNQQNSSYRWEGKWAAEPVTDLSVPMGAGNILSTAADLAAFFDGLFSGKLLSMANKTEMMKMVDGYGMGLFTFPFNNHTGFGHNGGIDGYHSMAGHFPESKTSFAILSNGLNFQTNDIAIALLSTAYGIPVAVPEFTTPADLAALPVGYEGVYGSDMMKMKITITREGNDLKMQATGQPAFVLEPLEKDVYQFVPAGVKVRFLPAEKVFLLQQGGAELRFTKEKAQ